MVPNQKTKSISLGVPQGFMLGPLLFLLIIILDTKIYFQNAVTFVLVQLDTKFKVQN